MTDPASQDPFAELGKRRRGPWRVILALLIVAAVGATGAIGAGAAIGGTVEAMERP